jgi:tripartite-type tricarboxylate transporter receptor subunit TctC
MTCKGLLALYAASVHGQRSAAKPMRVVTTEPGGSYDLTARLIGQG